MKSALTAFIALAVAAPLALAQSQPSADPPARVGTISDIEGSVVYAPAGETEWADAAKNRPVTQGDRVWTDEGARAELHFGSSALQMDGRTFVEAVAIDSDVVQLQLNEGTADARVRELQGSENFEIDTPNLAFRAAQPGDWRIDVDPQRGFTRVAVHTGTATVYGAGGGVQQLVAGQTLAFAGRDLAPAMNLPAMADDGFDRWAYDRNRAEDQSIAARYIPREVVGYQELDRYGTWAQDAAYGAVWYPTVTVADWAPYRYGRWEWVAPWGWTWIDDAPWGFAPFHYGRWAMVGARWCWVPGPIGPRPVYAPALVAFVGGGDVTLSISNGPGVAWYPLAPGEVWRPFFNASPRYARGVNRYVVSDSRYYNTGTPRFMHRADAITAVRIDDFHRGRPVHQSWSRLDPYAAARAHPATPPAPIREARRNERGRDVVRAPQAPPPQHFAQPIAPATPMRPPREFVPRAQPQPQFQPQPVPQPRPNWHGGEEGGYQSRWMQQQQPRPAFVQRQAPPPQAVYQHPRQEQRQEQRAQRQAQREEEGRGHRFE
jgi:hypothetical protein